MSPKLFTVNYSLLTVYGVVVQLVRTPACHAGGRGFESLPFRINHEALPQIPNWSHRLVVRTRDFQSLNRGSIPRGTELFMGD